MAATAGRVYLFKAEHTDKPDEYASELRLHGYQVAFVPVLDHSLESIPELREIIVGGPRHHGIGGIVFTSQRAVEAWCKALEDLRQPLLHTGVQSEWRSLTVYVVGPKTAERVSALDFFSSPEQWVVANRASELCDKILEAHRPQQGKLLFLAGDKRREELPSRMAEGGVPLEEIRVYATCKHPQLSTSLAAASFGPTDWAVFFSPSGVDYVEQEPDHARRVFAAKLCAIGPTTRDHLEKRDYRVHATADQPQASSLSAALHDYDTRNS